ncbi:YHS domain-containing (seleno)protein [Niastella populi]|uniref:YHS domain protein n=1 Tax=Niastella populi TaxID=550983 RepID=A0A1V9FPU6_9BACT|nr:YHS domain-containing (seleno)protein [Niastella populi]OQP60317.1 YHS domain protein [Niastella populi]
MKQLLTAVALLLVQVSISIAQDNAPRLKHFNLENHLAIQGYDPVAYFKQREAVKGRKEFAVSHQGVLYYFSSAANKEEFKKNPSHYEPQYGGWCAYAMGSKGEKVSIDPKTFKITNDRLYLFYNKFFNNTLTEWNKNEPGLKNKADVHWASINK